jgi:hypothetical protein
MNEKEATALFYSMKKSDAYAGRSFNNTGVLEGKKTFGIYLYVESSKENKHTTMALERAKLREFAQHILDRQLEDDEIEIRWVKSLDSNRKPSGGGRGR